MAGKSRIKGITIELGAETTGLDKALKDVNKQSRSLQTELKDVEKLLKFDPNNTALLAQKQKLLSDSVENTRKKLDQLKAAEAQVQQQFERGDIKEEQYRAFQRELADTARTMQRFETALQDMDREQQRAAEGQRDLTRLFDATESSVEDYANAIGQRLVNAINNGTATSRDMEHALQRIGRQALGSNVDLERLRSTLRSMDSGNSIQQVRQELQRLESQADDTRNALDELDYGIENVAGALLAGGGISGAIDKALDTSNLETKIDISFEVPESSKQSVFEAIKTVEAYGVDAEAALEGVRRQWALNKNASDETNASVVKMAATMASTFGGIDFNELIQEANEVAATLGITNEEALGLMNSLLKTGFPPEQLDIISEYGDQMAQAGYTAKEIQAIMAAGVDTKTWNIDNLLDGLKEGRIKMAEFGAGTDKATREIIDAAGLSIDKFEEWGAAIAKGGEKGQVAMLEATKALSKVDDAAARNQLGVKMFGTMWEDQGTKIIDTILNAEKKQVDLKEGTNDLKEAMSEWDSDPMIELQQAFADLLVALQPVLSVIAQVVKAFADWASNNPGVAATIVAVTTVLGILAGAVLALYPIFVALTAAAATAGISIGALLSPILAVVGVVAAIIAVIGILITVFVTLFQQNEAFREKVLEIWTAIQQIVSTVLSFIWGIISTVFMEIYTFISSILTQIMEFWNENGQQIMAIVSTVFNIIIGIIQIAMAVILPIIQGAWFVIQTVTRVVWETIKLIVGTAIAIVLGIIQTILKLLQGDWEGAWETIKKTAETIWDNIVKFFEGVDLVQIGKDILQGLIDGIGSMAGAVWDKVTEIGSSIKEGFTSFFKIKSPSRLMRDDVGKHIGAGLEVGLRQSQAKVNKASLALQEAATPAVPQATSNNINVSVPAAQIKPTPVVIDGYELTKIQFEHIDTMIGDAIDQRLGIKG